MFLGSFHIHYLSELIIAFDPSQSRHLSFRRSIDFVGWESSPRLESRRRDDCRSISRNNMGRNGHPVCTREAASSSSLSSLSLSLSLSCSFLVTQWWIDVSSSTADDAAVAASPPFSLLPSPFLPSLALSSPRPPLRSRNPWRARTGIPRRPKPKSQIDQLCSHFHLERDSEGERETLSLLSWGSCAIRGTSWRASLPKMCHTRKEGQGRRRRNF